VLVARTGTFAVAALLAAGLVSGCAAAGPSATAAASCGRTRTGVNVPVVVSVGRGVVSCPAAMSVEQAYAALVRAGDLRGNGGGAPVAVHGWTCQGYTSAEIAASGRVSVCARGGAEVFASLPAATATAGGPVVPS
jgi:hypothetical protein